MANVKCVLGLGFGDEGKGLMTDFFASQLSNPINFRFNGGAQAGHTVVYNGKRHVFSHFGSSSFRDTSTFLTKDFILNPFVFRQEYNELQKLDCNQRSLFIGYDPRCLVTTIYDMLYNQYLEDQRGVNRHGSCGLGINETVNRSAVVPFKLSDNRNVIIDDLNKVKEYYKDKMTYEIDEKVLNRFVDDCIFLTKNSEIVPPYYFDYDKEDMLFEGAQGLMLDEINGAFPHVTRSRTGMTNILNYELIQENDNKEICYATRIYATRHGNGPFWDNEEKVLEYFNVNDPTNKPNNWQGTLRLGLLNVDELKKFIDLDRSQLPGTKWANAKISLAVTCLNQIKDNSCIPFIWKGREYNYDGINSFISFLKKELNVSIIYEVYDHGDIAVRYEEY